MITTVTPFLMFEGRAEEAMTLYVSLFGDGRILELVRHPGTDATDGPILRARFSIGGQDILCSDSSVKHAFTFTASSSLFVEFETEGELMHVLEGLSRDCVTRMALDNYGFSRMFTWIDDCFGVSWQLNLP